MINSKNDFFRNVRDEAGNMRDIIQGIARKWDELCLNAWRNSPELQGDYEADAAGVFSGRGWRNDFEDLEIKYCHVKEFDTDLPGVEGAGWVGELQFIINHPDLECANRALSNTRTKKTHWFKADAYFVDTGIRVLTWRRNVSNYYKGSECIDMRFILLEKEWPQLVKSWEMMQVAKKLVPEDAEQLPDFAE